MKYANFKKLVAVATAMAVACTPVMAMAAESDDGATSSNGNISGTGSVEDYINKDVFKVVLPTVSDVNFTLDPQGLLSIADSTAYTLGAGAVYFANAGTDATTYSDTSDAIEIVNKSSYDIDVEFSVEITLPEGVTLVNSEAALADATTPSVYLAMQEAEADAATALVSGANAYATKQVAGIPETTDDAVGYEIVASGDAQNGYTYKYELNSTYDEADAARASYTITGACDTTADWTSVKDTSLTAKVVWSAEKHVDQAAPSINTLKYDYDRTVALTIPVSLGYGDLAAKTVKGLSVATTADGTYTTYTDWSYSDGAITFNSGGFPKAEVDASRFVKVTFDDKDNTTCIIELKITK